MVTRPVPGDTAATLDSIRALCDAADAFEGRIAGLETRLATAQGGLAAEAQARRQAGTGEAAARDAAIRRERQDRATAIAAAADELAGRLGALGEALRAETQARSGADEGERVARGQAIAAATRDLGGRIDARDDALRDA